jgi:hypothetical protein
MCVKAKTRAWACDVHDHEGKGTNDIWAAPKHPAHAGVRVVATACGGRDQGTNR